MRKHPLLMAALALTLGCDESVSPRIAHVSTGAFLPFGTEVLFITPIRTQVVVGSTVQLVTNAAIGEVVIWESLRPTIATVSQTGLVTAAGLGTASIRAHLVRDTLSVALATIDILDVLPVIPVIPVIPVVPIVPVIPLGASP